MVDLWVTVPPVYARNPYKYIMGCFAQATGYPPPMPHFATGFWHSKNRYRSQDEVLEAAHKYHALGIQPSVIAIDYLHWEHFGDFSFNPVCWPDPSAMVQELQQMGIHVMVSVWPFVQSQATVSREFNSTSGPSVNYEPMRNAGLLVRQLYCTKTSFCRCDCISRG